MILTLNAEASAQIHPLAVGSDSTFWSVFDPDSLPDDFDAKCHEHSLETLESLRSLGVAFSHGSDSDGSDLSMTLHYAIDGTDVHIDSSYQLLASFPSFPIPSGRLVFCGSEYLCRDPLRGSPATPDGGLEEYSHMGTIVSLPYSKAVSLDIYHYPNSHEHRQNLLREQVPQLKRVSATSIGFLCYLIFVLFPLLVMILCAIFVVTLPVAAIFSLVLRNFLGDSFQTPNYGALIACIGGSAVLRYLALLAFRRGPPALVQQLLDSSGMGQIMSELERVYPAFLIVIHPTDGGGINQFSYSSEKRIVQLPLSLVHWVRELE